jgi:V/A-type H+-transporting ATPase subunit C
MDAIDTYYSTKQAILLDLTIDNNMYENLLYESTKSGSDFIEEYIRLSIDLSNIQTAYRAKGVAGHEIIRKSLFAPGGKIDDELLFALIDNRIKDAAIFGNQYGLARISQAVSEYPLNPFAIERESDNTLSDHLRPSKFMIWGMEPVFSFGFAVEMELKILGIIISCKKLSLGPEWIRKRLPEPF